MKQNLAALLLSGTDAERVSRAKKAYQDLRDLYETKPTPKGKFAILIADLILTEEEDPQAEIAALKEQKDAVVPLLIDLLRSEDFHDALFPGYGRAPALAARSLGEIGGKRALISLFESLGNEDFFDENVLLDSLKAIGDPAKEFLLKVVRGRPFNEDNENAAIGLGAFKQDSEVSKA